MAQIGCLGDIIFISSSDKVETFSNAQWSGSARHAVHQRHNYHALTEFTGLDPDRMSLDISLTDELGVDVMAELVKIWTYERGPVTLPLVIGEKAYGKYRWVIEKHKITMKYFNRDGNLKSAAVSLNLLEYLSV